MAEEPAVRRAILEAIQSSPRPLTFKDLRQAYEGPKVNLEDLRRVLGICVTAGAVIPCPNFRYWHQDEKTVHLEAARKLIAEKPRTKAELIRELGKLGTGATENWRASMVEILRNESGIHLLPGLGQSRVCRLSTEPPKLADYIDKAKTEYRKALQTLTSIGFSESEVVEAVCGVSPLSGEPMTPEPESKPIQPPESDDELDFQRDASELLVYAWQDADSAEARELIEDTLYSLGLDPIGSEGQEVEFDGRFQHTSSTLSPGQKVKVVQHGWELRNARGAHLIAKARVQPCSN